MKLAIKFNQEHFDVEVDDAATVRDLKKQLAARQNCKVTACRLVYSARALQNDQRLSSYDILPTKYITLIVEETPRDPGRRSRRKTAREAAPPLSELDHQFCDALRNSPMKQYLDDAEVLAAVTRIGNTLSRLQDPNYDGVVRRLQLIPQIAKEPDDAIYEEALSQMAEMGIGERQINLRALKLCGGDPYEAIEWLIGNGVVGPKEQQDPEQAVNS
jgi:hypothetical protein